MVLSKNGPKNSNPKEDTIPAINPAPIATETFYIKSALAPAITPPAMVELSTFSTVNLPLFQKGVIKNVLRAEEEIEKNVFMTILYLPLPEASAELKLGQ